MASDEEQKKKMTEQEELENKQNESWREELLPEARERYKDVAEVPDKDKKKYENYFTKAKRSLLKAKAVIPNTLKDINKYKEEIRNTIQKIKEAKAAMAKNSQYKATVMGKNFAKEAIAFLNFCSKTAKADINNLQNIISSGAKKSYRIIVGYVMGEDKRLNINIKPNTKNPVEKNKESEEDKIYWGKVRTGLEKTKNSHKKIAEERKALKKLVDDVEKAIKSGEKKIIDVEWAKQQIKEYKAVEEVALVKIANYEGLLSSKVKGVVPQAMRLEPKKRKMKEIADAGNGGATLPKEQEKPKEKKEEEIKTLKTKNKVQSQAQKTAVPARGAESLVKPENAKLKEVARGVNEQVAIQAAARERVDVKTAEGAREVQIGLSKQAEKELLREERRQEKEYKKIEITAEKTVFNENQKETVLTEQKEKGETQQARKPNAEKQKADESRKMEMAYKIEQLRKKFDKLQEKRAGEVKTENNVAQNMATQRDSRETGMAAASKGGNVELNQKEMKAMPSVKAEMSLSKAEASMDISAVERAGGVTEASLQKMETMVHKAESGLKTATMVPDYATAEFKQKAAEQGLKENLVDKKQQDMEKLKTLSGRSNEGSENVDQNQQGVQNEQGQSQGHQLSINPEKSKAMDAQKSGKQIDMKTYQNMKLARGGRATG